MFAHFQHEAWLGWLMVALTGPPFYIVIKASAKSLADRRRRLPR